MRVTTTHTRRFAASLVALLLVTAALGPVGTVSAQSVSIGQTALTSTTVAPGDTVTVEATIEYSDVNSPAIDVTLPSGWTVVSHTDDGGTYGPPQPAWAWLEGDSDGVTGNHTVSYTVQVPSDAADGTYTISAEGSGIDPATSEVVSATDGLTVTVETPVENQPPTADAGADQTVVENDTVQLDASGSSDPDGDALGYAWTVLDDGGTGVSLADGDTATPTFTAPSVASETVLTFEVAVTDGNGGTDNDAVSVTVEPAAEPSAPNVTITQAATTSTTIAPGENVTVEATIQYSDVNSPAIDVTLPSGWTVVSHTDDGGTYGPPEPAWAWLEGDSDGVSGSHTVSYTVQAPGGAADGTYTFSAEGSGIDPDTSEVVSDTDDVTVTVEAPAVNQPPSADAGADQTVTEGESVTLDASGSSDPDGDTLSYSWSVTDDAGTGVSLSGADTATPTFTAPTVSGETTLTFAVAVDDGNGGTDTDSVNVTVQPVAEPLDPNVTISQTATSSTTVDQGENLTVEATIEYEDVNSPAIDVTLPAGWTVTSHTDDGGTYGPPVPAWAWAEGDADGVTGSHTVTYTVQVPSDAATGTYAIAAEGSGIDPSDTSFVNDTDELTVTVEAAPEPPGATDVSVTPDSGIEASTYTSGSFQIENTGGQAIESVTFDLSTSSLPEVVFDPQGTAGDGAAKGFTPDSGASTTGLVDGTFSQPHNGVDGDDGYDVLTITFDDFQPGESFAFSADNDPTSIKDATLASQEAGPISGLELARSTVTVGYDDGSTQTAQLVGDGSAGGSQALLGPTVAGAPALDVSGVSLDADVLDDRHSAATVADASQTVTVTGPADTDVTLLRVEAELELDNVPEFDGTPGYEIEAYEANHAQVVEYDTANTGADGVAELAVTLTNSTPEGGYNYLVASAGDAAMGSNVVVLQYDPDFEPPNEPPTAAFSYSPTDPVVDETVTFDAAASSDADGTVVSYDWTVDGGPSATVLLDADFEEGTLAGAGWTHDAVDPDAEGGVSDATSNSGAFSAYHAFGEGALVSPVMDADGASSLTVEYWVQEGNDAFSEDPNPGEDLSVQYLAENGTWVEIALVEADGSGGGEVSTGSLTLSDPAAFHAGFQLRFYELGATAGDYWHVDDVVVTAEGLGDGASLSGETVTHAFATAGEHEVTLTVTDDDGATDTTTQTVVVNASADETLTVLEAIASLNEAGDDTLVDTTELQVAIDYWVEDEPVPDTGGATISTTELQALIDLWVEDEPINGGSG